MGRDEEDCEEMAACLMVDLCWSLTSLAAAEEEVKKKQMSASGRGKQLAHKDETKKSDRLRNIL